MGRAQELEEAVTKMHASAKSIRLSIEEMVEILRDTNAEDRSGGLRIAWRQMVEELTAAAQTASKVLQDH